MNLRAVQGNELSTRRSAQRMAEFMLFKNLNHRMLSLRLCGDIYRRCQLHKLAGSQRDTKGRIAGKSGTNDGVLTGFGRTAGRSNGAALEATSLAKLFGRYAKGLQTPCRNRSIMRQNVSEVDCFPYWYVSHNVMGIGLLQQSDMLDTKGKRHAHLKDGAVAQVGNLRHRLTKGPGWGGLNSLKELQAAEQSLHSKPMCQCNQTDTGPLFSVTSVCSVVEVVAVLHCGPWGWL